jgi:hypothetical protein
MFKKLKLVMLFAVLGVSSANAYETLEVKLNDGSLKQVVEEQYSGEYDINYVNEFSKDAKRKVTIRVKSTLKRKTNCSIHIALERPTERWGDKTRSSLSMGEEAFILRKNKRVEFCKEFYSDLIQKYSL